MPGMCVCVAGMVMAFDHWYVHAMWSRPARPCYTLLYIVQDLVHIYGLGCMMWQQNFESLHCANNILCYI